MTRYDEIVIGGGLLGSAIAYGLVRSGLDTALGSCLRGADRVIADCVARARAALALPTAVLGM